MVDRVAGHVYTREILRLLDEVARAEALVHEQLAAAKLHLQECYDAGRFASTAGELPTQRWWDEAHDVVDAAGVRLQEIAQGGRRQERNGGRGA